MATAAPEIKPDFSAPKRHFCITDEHEQLRETIQGFCRKELAPHSDEWEESGFPDSVFKRMGDLGFLGVYFPEEYGGQGGDYFMSLMRGEAMAHSNNGGLAMGIAVHTDMATPPILKFGSEYLKQTYLVPSIKGEMISSLGITEPGAGSDVAGIRTRAVRDGDEYVINGSKTFITNGVRADYIVLVTKTDSEAGYDGFSLFLVPKDTPGFHVSRKLDKLGMHSSDTAELTFDELRVPAGNLIGAEGRGFQQQMNQFQNERMIAAYNINGAIKDALARTRSYLTERKAFGAPLLANQYPQFVLAELAAEARALEALTHDCAAQYLEGVDTSRDTTICKLLSARLLRRVADWCLQFHGGIGYMEETWTARFFRDARLWSIGGGADEIMLRTLARTEGFSADG